MSTKRRFNTEINSVLKAQVEARKGVPIYEPRITLANKEK